MTFCKYEFLNTKDWEKYKTQITEDGNPVNCAIVEIGNICLATDTEGNCINLSPLYAVDILWNNEPLDSFSKKEVFPNPVGVHTFSGCEELYKNRFCQFNDNSPYCITLNETI